MDPMHQCDYHMQLDPSFQGVLLDEQGVVSPGRRADAVLFKTWWYVRAASPIQTSPFVV